MPYSQHIFLFPFQWDYNHVDKALKKASFSEKTNLKYVESLMEGQLYNHNCPTREAHNRWNRFQFKVEKPSDYNELTYFYPYVRDILFDGTNNDSNKKLVLQYSYELGNGAKYEFKAGDVSISLDITSITLNFYFTGIGILAFHLDNSEPSQQNFHSVLKINDFGRRIFPQFLSTSGQHYTASAKSVFLADEVRIKNSDCIITESESFDYYNSLANCNTHRLPKFIQSLLGCKFVTDAPKPDNVQIKPFGDDRMFTISWMASDSVVGIFKKPVRKTPASYQYEVDKNWYSYVFTDQLSHLGIANKSMMQQHIKRHTYDRWIEAGTLYGFTDYSFVCLTQEGYFGELIKTHMKTIYFQLISLCLVQRFSILRFTDETAQLSGVNEESLTVDWQMVGDLQEKYTLFINKMYFRDVTPQLQGIELYTSIIGIMHIERNAKDLSKEIDDVFQRYHFKFNQVVERKINLLTILVSVFAIPTLLVGFLGMNLFDTNSFSIFKTNPPIKYAIFSCIILVICFFTYVLVMRPKRKTIYVYIKGLIKNWQAHIITVIILMGLILATLAILFLPTLNHCLKILWKY